IAERAFIDMPMGTLVVAHTTHFVLGASAPAEMPVEGSTALTASHGILCDMTVTAGNKEGIQDFDQCTAHTVSFLRAYPSARGEATRTNGWKSGPCPPRFRGHPHTGDTSANKASGRRDSTRARRRTLCPPVQGRARDASGNGRQCNACGGQD